MILDRLNVAWVQHTATGNVEANLSTIASLVVPLLTQKPDIVVLPEAFAWLEIDAIKQLQWAEDIGSGRLQQQLADWAIEWQCYVVAGSLPMRFDGQIYATLCVFNPLGQLETFYRKQHLFSVVMPSGQRYQEGELFAEGPVPVVWYSPWGAIGLAICFDLRFATLFAHYRQQGVRLVLLPAAFTAETGRAHWHVLVRARAIEQQMVMLAVNQTGRHEVGLQSYGHSLLVDPWGNVLVDSGESVCANQAMIDLCAVDHLRKRFPII